MALFKFTQKISSGSFIEIYNYGKMKRDFTNVYDLVKAIKMLINKIPHNPNQRKRKIRNDSISDTALYRIVNIGNSKPINLVHYISELEKTLGIVFKKNF